MALTIPPTRYAFTNPAPRWQMMKNRRSSPRTGMMSPYGVPISSPVAKYSANAYLFHTLAGTSLPSR